jgi:PHD/YefM family antitoxin component YafN of YafNO toxin-antitoxin module
MTIIPMRDLKNTVEIEKKCAEANGPVFVTKNGYGRLVVMDLEYYEKTMQQLNEAKQLLSGLEDIKQGNVEQGEVVKTKLKEKYGF